MKTITKLLIGYLILILLLWGCSYLFSSCRIEKEWRKSTADSIHVKKEISGSVSRSEQGSEMESDYTRKTWIYPTQDRDTLTLQPQIKNFYNTLPVAYIEEHGKQKENTWHFNTDSAWRALVDSINKSNQTTVKTKDTDFIGWPHIIAACIGTAFLVLIVVGLIKLISKFKITKK